MTPITIILIARAVPGLECLDLEKALDSLIVPGVIIEDYEIAGLDDAADPAEEAYYEASDWQYERRGDR